MQALEGNKSKTRGHRFPVGTILRVIPNSFGGHNVMLTDCLTNDVPQYRSTKVLLVSKKNLDKTNIESIRSLGIGFLVDQVHGRSIWGGEP